KLLFGNSDEDYGKEKDYVDMVLSTRVDGVLFAPAGDRSAEHLQSLRRHNIPFVLLDRDVPGIEADQVLGDNREGARRLVEHLIEIGHKRIAMINAKQDVSTARLRYNGYIEALKLNDIPFDPALVHEAGYTLVEDSGLVDELFAVPNPPTAVFAANNFLALAVIRALRTRSIRVPEHLSVV